MAEQPAQQPPPPEPPPPETPQQRAQAIAGVLAVGMLASAGAGASVGPLLLTPKVLAMLTRLFLRFGLRREAVRWGLRVVTRVVRTSPPPQGPTPPGPAELATRRAERMFVAWFLERTTARVDKAYADGAEDGAPEQREDRFLEQHLTAQDRRYEAARRTDVEAAKRDQVVSMTDATDDDNPGMARVILKWRAHPDDKVTPECRAADGAWFYADTPPIIGYPGMPHGGTCRCWSAHAGSLAEVARGRHVNEAVRAILATEPDHRDHPGTTERLPA